MTQALEFNINENSIPVTIDGVSYTLVEASGESVIAYRDKMIKATKPGPDGKPTRIEGITELEPFFVSCCLRDSEGVRVPENKIKSWPYRVQKTLFDKASAISGLKDSGSTEEEIEKQIENLQTELERKKQMGKS